MDCVSEAANKTSDLGLCHHALNPKRCTLNPKRPCYHHLLCAMRFQQDFDVRFFSAVTSRSFYSGAPSLQITAMYGVKG